MVLCLQEVQFLEKCVAETLAKLSKAYDLLGRVDVYVDPENPKARANVWHDLHFRNVIE